jgi:uncharacterized membrane protein
MTAVTSSLPRTLDLTTALHPARLFAMLSLIVGLVVVLINPPLRGPDEPAHFVRIHAFAHGVILPVTEFNGRKGIYIPAELNDDFDFFNKRRHEIWTRGFTFRNEMAGYQALRDGKIANDQRPPVFVAFEGSEPYNPVAYAPHIAAGLVARAFGLDFVSALTLMRLTGLLVFTALSAYAIALTPRLKWAFFLIAMLPASLYGRAVLGADGAVNALSLLATALALKTIAHPGTVSVLERALVMALCVLSKPPQAAFVLLEPMVHRFRDLPRALGTIALVSLPGIALTLLWIWAIDAEMAAWRVHDSGQYAAEQFSLRWKLGFMLENPLHFPAAMITTIGKETFGLWRQLIGVLGWLDTHLPLWVYIAISGCLIATFCEKLMLDARVRLRIALWSALTIALYVTAVFLILFVTWTPVTEAGIWGVQGRYFVPVLPAAALLIAALIDLHAPLSLRAGAALAGTAIGAVAVIEGLWRVNWAG